jgi:glutamate synthase domain-containing protein 2
MSSTSYFTWTASRVGGIGLDVIAKEVLLRHHAAFPERQVNGHVLPRRAASTSGAPMASTTCSPGVDPPAAEGRAHRQFRPTSPTPS